jgi:hypothetical protein
VELCIFLAPLWAVPESSFLVHCIRAVLNFCGGNSIKEFSLADFVPPDTTSSCKFSRRAKPGRLRQSVLICEEHPITRDLNFNGKGIVTAIRPGLDIPREMGREAKHKIDSRQYAGTLVLDLQVISFPNVPSG